MIIRAVLSTLFLILLVCSPVIFAQSSAATPTNTTLLTVGGEVAQPLKLGAADLAKLPHRSITAREHNGKEAQFQGVELIKILQMAGVKFGEQLRGKDLALFLVAEGADGYRAVFALAEIDPDYNDRIILLADNVRAKHSLKKKDH